MAPAQALWLDGIEIDSGERRAEMRFPIGLNGGFLEGLVQGEVFWLKAFLEHGSLAAQEIRDILRVTHGDAERILRRLLDADVVGPAPREKESFSGNWVGRFRIRPVAVPPVQRFLERRNVLHP